jgi:hypothetical protein
MISLTLGTTVVVTLLGVIGLVVAAEVGTRAAAEINAKATRDVARINADTAREIETIKAEAAVNAEKEKDHRAWRRLNAETFLEALNQQALHQQQASRAVAHKDWAKAYELLETLTEESDWEEFHVLSAIGTESVGEAMNRWSVAIRTWLEQYGLYVPAKMQGTADYDRPSYMVEDGLLDARLDVYLAVERYIYEEEESTHRPVA